MAKIRNGFVSNSSSSSFIIIGNKDLVIPKQTSIIVGESGETGFGWDQHVYRDFETRLNFCWLQAFYSDSYALGERREMIRECLKKHGIEIVGSHMSIDGCNSNGYHSYIDHQSSACEDRNTEMFESMENLEKFLFAPDSEIHTDNDNH